MVGEKVGDVADETGTQQRPGQGAETADHRPRCKCNFDLPGYAQEKASVIEIKRDWLARASKIDCNLRDVFPTIAAAPPN